MNDSSKKGLNMLVYEVHKAGHSEIRLRQQTLPILDVISGTLLL